MLDADQAADYTGRYDDIDPGILSDGSRLLDRPEFWAGLLDGFADTDLARAVVDGAPGMADLWAETAASGRWPVLRFGAGDSDLAVIQWHGCRDTHRGPGDGPAAAGPAGPLVRPGRRTGLRRRLVTPAGRRVPARGPGAGHPGVVLAEPTGPLSARS